MAVIQVTPEMLTSKASELRGIRSSTMSQWQR